MSSAVDRGCHRWSRSRTRRTGRPWCRPFLVSSVMSPIVSRERYSRGYSEARGHGQPEVRSCGMIVASDRLELRRFLDPANADDDVLGAGVRQLAEAFDDLVRAVAPAPAVGAEVDAWSVLARSRRSRARSVRSARAGPRTCGRSAVGPPKTFVASAYWATSRSVFCSPPPPIMIGTRGREIDWGELSSRSAWTWRPSKRSSLPRSPCHISWAIRRVSSSISKRSPSGGNGKPRARLSISFQAAPIPSQARPPDRTSSVVVALTHRPG